MSSDRSETRACWVLGGILVLGPLFLLMLPVCLQPPASKSDSHAKARDKPPTEADSRNASADQRRAWTLLDQANGMITDNPAEALALCARSEKIADLMDKIYLRKLYFTRAKAEDARNNPKAVVENMRSYAGLMAYDLESEPWELLLKAYRALADPRADKLAKILEALKSGKKEGRPTSTELKAVIGE
jgi:hypothetical protein